MAYALWSFSVAMLPSANNFSLLNSLSGRNCGKKSYKSICWGKFCKVMSTNEHSDFRWKKRLLKLLDCSHWSLTVQVTELPAKFQTDWFVELSVCLFSLIVNSLPQLQVWVEPWETIILAFERIFLTRRGYSEDNYSIDFPRFTPNFTFDTEYWLSQRFWIFSTWLHLLRIRSGWTSSRNDRFVAAVACYVMSTTQNCHKNFS